MRRVPLRLLLGLALAAAGPALAAPPTGLPAGALEKKPLFGGSTAAEWVVAESTVQPSTERVKATPASLHWHIPVDHTAGEVRYPVGWPRFNHAIPEGPLRDWSAYDFLHLWVYVETSRATLPGTPVTLILHTPDKAMAYTRTLAEVRKGEWVEISLPLAQVPRTQDVRLIQFSIAESNYSHGDTVDFYIDDLALVRYAQPVLLDFAAESGVMFADARRVPVRFRLSGVKPGESVPVACELRQNGRLAAKATATATRGPQRLSLDLGAKPLPPGTYELSARVPGGRMAASAPLRLVESPW